MKRKMAEEQYTLFHSSVLFSESELRFYDLLHFMEEAQRKCASAFTEWYEKCTTIDNVLANYFDFARKTIFNVVIAPLYNQLSDFEIYDISEETYWKNCKDGTAINEAYKSIENNYLTILHNQATEEAYRSARKNSRDRFVGWGYGMSGAINASVKAGALNALTGLGHSVINGIGNGATAIKTERSLDELYYDSTTQLTLLEAIMDEIDVNVTCHMECLNQHFPGIVLSSFNIDKSKALLENAKKVPQKCNELLTQAIIACPWNTEVVSHIFINYPEERKEISRLASRFHVDLSKNYEAILEKEYNPETEWTEAELETIKNRIQSLMCDYGITKSKTLDALDNNALMLYTRCISSANEQQCGEIQAKIQEYACSDAIKQPYFKQVQDRIDAIWSTEDAKIFDNVYLSTNIRDPNQVNEAISFIQSKGRTATAEQYIKALKTCSEKNIKIAQKWQNQKHHFFPIFLGFAGLIFAIFTYGLTAVLSIMCFVGYAKKKRVWRNLTLNGKILHPLLLAQGHPYGSRLDGAKGSAATPVALPQQNPGKNK